MSHFSPRDDEGGVLEHDKLLELSTAEGQQELYDYCNRPRRSVYKLIFFQFALICPPTKINDLTLRRILFSSDLPSNRLELSCDQTYAAM